MVSSMSVANFCRSCSFIFVIDLPCIFPPHFLSSSILFELYLNFGISYNERYIETGIGISFLHVINKTKQQNKLKRYKLFIDVCDNQRHFIQHWSVS